MMCVEGEGGWMMMCREVKFKLTNISVSTLLFPLLVSLLLTRHLCVWKLTRVSGECLLRSPEHWGTGERQNHRLLDERLCSCFK